MSESWKEFIDLKDVIRNSFPLSSGNVGELEGIHRSEGRVVRIFRDPARDESESWKEFIDLKD